MMSGIDRDGGRAFSAAGQASYAENVRQDLSLTLDGHAEPLRLVWSRFPAVDQLTAGTGDIELRFEAEMLGAGYDHQLDFENRHARAIAVYLVNTLLPRSPGLGIVSQERSYDQSSYHLNFSVEAGPQTGAVVKRTDRLAIAGSYVWHGVHHILTGYDHLLFVAALALRAATLWDLIKVVSAFTLAHSLTLTLAALNLIHLPDAVVEPLISASIVFVAIQNVIWPEQARGGSRLAVALFFGLFHGLGFRRRSARHDAPDAERDDPPRDPWLQLRRRGRQPDGAATAVRHTEAASIRSCRSRCTGQPAQDGPANRLCRHLCRRQLLSARCACWLSSS